MRRALLLLLFLAFVAHASAQEPMTGYPPYGSFQNGQFDAVNHQNLNVNFAIPIVSSPGRETALAFAIRYDSLIWRRNGNAWSPVTSGVSYRGWKTDSVLGSIVYSMSMVLCGLQKPRHYYDFAYVDPAGTRHDFDLDFYSEETDCGFPTGPREGYAIDGSGYYLDASTVVDLFGDPPFVISRGGVKIDWDSLTDTNGNYISRVSGGTNETHWIDTAGRIALKVKKPSTTTTEYRVLDPTGGYQLYTLAMTTYNIKTNFACSGVTEYTGSATLPTSLTLPNGRTYAFTYEDTPGFAGYKSGRVRRVTLPTGGYYEYQYPTTGNKGINCSDGTGTSLTRVINDGTSRTWTFARAPSGSNWITTVSAPILPYDSAANQSTYTFDSTGKLTSQKLYQGSTTGTLLRTINTSWAANNTPASTTVILESNLQSKTETTFDTYGRMTQLKEYAWGSGAPGGLVRTTDMSYQHSILDRVTQVLVKDSAGTVKSRTDTVYDEVTYSNVACPAGALQHDDTNFGCSFYARGNPTTITTYVNAASQGGPVAKHFYYDWFGNLRKADVNCCQQKEWSYSSTTEYAFPNSVTDGSPGGAQLTTSFTYNASTGQPTTTTDPNNKTTSFSYDSLKRLTTVTRPDSQQITTSYDDANRIVTVEVPIQGTDRAKQKSYFDQLGRPFKQCLLDNNNTVISCTETQYDSLGRPYKASNPYTVTAQYWTETRLDALGRPTLVIPPDGSPTSNRTQYTHSGNTVTVTDPTGKQRKSETDAQGRLFKVYEPDVTQGGNPLTQLTTNTYNALDLLTQVSQGSQTRTYNYDDMGRLTSATTPEAGTVSYQYNGFNLVTLRTDARGVDTTYTYDTLNRLQQVSYDVSGTTATTTSTVTFTYGTSATQNNNGRLITMTDGTGSESYTYDTLGRITQVTKLLDSVSYPTGYAYNLAGELTSVTYPSGRVVQHNYDPVGRLTKVFAGATTYADQYGYNVAGQVTGFNYGNGVVAAFTYSPERLQLATLKYTKNTTKLLDVVYGYTQSSGNNGQIASITDNTGTQEGGRSATYIYDALARLKEAYTNGSTTYPKWHYIYNYDRYGNLTAMDLQPDSVGQHPELFLTVSATTNRITDSNFTYDSAGNLTQDGIGTGTHAYKYDGENHVTLVDNGSTATYTYDGAGLRVKKVAGSTTTRYIFSGSKVVAEYVNGAAVGSPTREYIYSASQLLATLEGGTTTYHHQDQLSVRVNSNTSGTSVGQQGNYPFGMAWYSTSTTTKWRFTSYERDSESALDYAMFRYDSSRLGRFLSPDPVAGSVADPQSLNRYAYVGNDPVNLVDPLGLQHRQIFPFEYAGSEDFSTTGTFCYLDGMETSCSIALTLLASGAAAPCPNNDCTGIRVSADGVVYQSQLVRRWQTPSHFGLACDASDPEQPCTLSIDSAAYQWAYVRVGTVSDVYWAFPGFIGRLAPNQRYSAPRRPPLPPSAPRLIPGDPIPRGAPGPDTPIPPRVQGPHITPNPNLPLWKRIAFAILQGANAATKFFSGISVPILLMPNPCLDPTLNSQLCSGEPLPDRI